MSNGKGLEGKVAVVTGGGRGIGRAICLALARESAEVAVTSTTQERNLKVAAEINTMGGRAFAIAADVTDAGEVEAMARGVLEEFGRCDILVCNAGVQRYSPFLHTDFEKWKNVLEVNVYGTYHCCQAFMPGMMERNAGRVIILSSIMGKMPSPFYTSYSVAKHGLIGLTRSLAAEMAALGAKGVTVNAVCPGFTDTDMVTGPQGTLTRTAEKLGASVEETWERFFGSLSLQDRMLEPEEVAAAVTYLSSDDARGITGQALNVCGGSVFY